MSDAIQRAILRTLIYADIFSYPLTLAQLHKFLIFNRPVSKKNIKNICQQMSSVRKEDDFYMLKKSRINIAIRKIKEASSNEKIAFARQLTRIFRIIPWVLFVGISGAVAAGNARKKDDIDFFVIAKRKRLWLTRFFLVILLQIFGLRRKRLEKKVMNTICLNMLLDERCLLLGSKRQDVYTAHEIVQMLPIFDRGDTYSRFLMANKWVRGYLPNSIDTKILRYYDIKKKSPNIPIFQYFSIIELIAKQLQLWYMRKHRTHEIITDNMLAFHPVDYRKKVLFLYTKRLKQYGIV
ncbi:MAG: hypothetical protein HY429_01660 [Candidatus Levybacteria bacterium]|nr:hypothetical protein [Candidatus Levybacteria bacterium]